MVVYIFGQALGRGVMSGCGRPGAGIGSAEGQDSVTLASLVLEFHFVLGLGGGQKYFIDVLTLYVYFVESFISLAVFNEMIPSRLIHRRQLSTVPADCVKHLFVLVTCIR